MPSALRGRHQSAGSLGRNIDYSRPKLSCSGAAVESAGHPTLPPVAVGSAGLVGGYPAVVAANFKRSGEPASDSLDTGTTPAPSKPPHGREHANRLPVTNHPEPT